MTARSIVPAAKASKSTKASAKKPALLAGGNPQIAKADGDAAVLAYIAAMPGWKSGVGRRLDALIVRTVPGVRKAVKWNSPFYGVEGQGWFLSFHPLPDGSRKPASTLPNRATGSCVNSTPLARIRS